MKPLALTDEQRQMTWSAVRQIDALVLELAQLHSIESICSALGNVLYLIQLRSRYTPAEVLSLSSGGWAEPIVTIGFDEMADRLGELEQEVENLRSVISRMTPEEQARVREQLVSRFAEPT